MLLLLPLFSGIIGITSTWLLLRLRYHRQEIKQGRELATLQERLSGREGEVAEIRKQWTQEQERVRIAEGRTYQAEAQVREMEVRLETERSAFKEKSALLDEARTKLSDAFKALSSEALKQNNGSFLELARTHLERFQSEAKGDLHKRQEAIGKSLQPIEEALRKFDQEVREMEKAREGAYHGLRQQVQALAETQNILRNQTGSLLQALRVPSARGRWGEIQLKRVVEMAGMLDHCDFFTQQHRQHEEGSMRPDLVVRLPGGKQIVVDAKAPLQAYLEALEVADEGGRKEKLKTHAGHIRQHISLLSKKGYWSQFRPTPEFVVLFLPGEIFFSAALEQDPSLIEEGVDHGVILATPTTLIALLRSVAYGWRQEALSQNAEQVSELGRELYKRLTDLGGHVGKMGKNLSAAVNNYNMMVGTLESRVLVSARRFRELGSAPEKSEIEVLSQIEQAPRLLQSPELACESSE